MQGPTEPLPYFALVALLLLIVHSRPLETHSGNQLAQQQQQENK